jgi:non-specific serine/threonine protein kinase
VVGGPAGRPTNLAPEPTSFVGREQEIGEVKLLLDRSRLVTLTGAGGAGKTRLALRVAAELVDEYPDGVWVAELAGLADPALLPRAVLVALGASDAPDQAGLDALAEFLRTRRLLLVLDNCEHLVEACADLVDALLRRCHDVRVLVTSREVLRVAAEVVWRVPSLSAPAPGDPATPEALAGYAAVRLFVDRARAAAPGFALTHENGPAVAAVCRRLDGIPLALELAAARARLLPVDEIAARLDEAFGPGSGRFRLLTGGSRNALRRHQTLRALVDWSHDLLSEPERVDAIGETLRARLGPAAFGAAWDKGVAMTLEQVLDHALSDDRG